MSLTKRFASHDGPDWWTGGVTSPGFLTGSWQGLLALAGTSKPIVDKMHGELMKFISQPGIRERLATLGAESNAMTPAQFGDWLKSEIRTMAKVVKDGKVTVD